MDVYGCVCVCASVRACERVVVCVRAQLERDTRTLWPEDVSIPLIFSAAQGGSKCRDTGVTCL